MFLSHRCFSLSLPLSEINKKYPWMRTEKKERPKNTEERLVELRLRPPRMGCMRLLPGSLCLGSGPDP